MTAAHTRDFRLRAPDRGAALQTADHHDKAAVNDPEPASNGQQTGDAHQPSDIEMPDADQPGQSTVIVYGPRRGNENEGEGGSKVNAVKDTSQVDRLMLVFRNVDLKGKGKAKVALEPQQQSAQHQQGSFDEGFQAHGQTDKGKGKAEQKKGGVDQQGDQQLQELPSDEEAQTQAQTGKAKKGKKGKNKKKKGKGRK